MSEGFDLYTLVFLGLAVFIFFRLRSVLGTRTGNEPPAERPRRERPGPASTSTDNVVPLPGRVTEEDEPQEKPFRWTGFAAEGSELAAGFDAIVAADRSFNPKVFAQGAKAAYEMIVNAFNDGDRKTLKSLLSREVFDGFVQSINEREARGEVVEGRFVSLDKAEIVEASMKGKSAHVTVRFISQMISVTKGKDGAIIDGSPDKITEVIDQWTFARDTTINDPNWRLVATDEGA
jgi:predicted lipid-binding transport protein (Tim44 family)